MLRALLILLSTILLFSCLRTEEDSPAQYTPFLNVDNTSADSLLLKMTLEEKIGQMIVLKTNMKNENVQNSVFQWVKEGKIGGVLLNDLELDNYIALVDTLNQLSKTPLFHATQEVVLLNNQFSDAVQFPQAPSIGSISNDTIQKDLEDLYVQQCKAAGINFCFTPSANQVSSENKNYPLQVFENDTKRKLERASRVLQNLQKEKIISLGNSFSDFYQLENDTTGVLDSLLRNQRFLAEKGVSGFFIDEQIFEVDSLKGYQTFFLKNYLKNKMDFDGLLVAEVSENATIDELIHAGTDIFIIENSADVLLKHLVEFVKEGLISEKVVNEKVRNILLAKTYSGLIKKPEPINKEVAKVVLKNQQLKFYARQLFEKSITLAHNHNDLLPYTKTYRRDFRIINIGEDKLEVFKDYFSKYANYQNYNHIPDETGKIKPLKTVFHKHATSIVVLDNVLLDTLQHKEFIKSINDLSETSKITIVNFGNPFNLNCFDTALTMIQVFEKNKITESLVPQLLFGGMSAQGMLPLAINENLPYGKHVNSKTTRLKYTVPEEVGISPEKLVGIDAIIQSAISKKATPGGQVLVIKDGKVFFNKSFGHHTYKKQQRTRSSDLYDIASVTKVAATSIASMKLFEKKKFKLRDRLKDHFDLEKKSKIGRVTFKELLTHSSGLQANMPISKYYLSKDTFQITDDCNQYFCNQPNGNYSIQLANKMYMDKRWVDSLWQKVESLKPKRRGRYKYSDVNFNLLQRFIEKETSQPLNDYLNDNFYKSLNLRRTAYRPLEKFDASFITPTELDDRWRKQTLRGFVHDESASLLGGVAGNSGLFSNANDLGVLFQMLLNGGVYGDQKYLEKSTIEKFTKASYGNHRGLGFVVKGKRGANSLSKKASRKTYGHSGFTGTCVWVDPDNGLIYIFLSNRIHPNKSNTKLYRNQVRRRIHDVVYKALDTYKIGESSVEKILVDLKN